MNVRPISAVALLLLVACTVDRGWTKADISEKAAADDVLTCWSHAVKEAHDQFAAERQWQKLALLNIRDLQSGEIKIDDGFETLMVQSDEIQWRGERFRECMARRGYTTIADASSTIAKGTSTN